MTKRGSDMRRYFLHVVIVCIVCSAVLVGCVAKRNKNNVSGSADMQKMEAALEEESRSVLALASNIEGARYIPLELPEEYQNQSPPSGAAREFSTEFSRGFIDYRDIISGGPPKDGIPSIDAPNFVSIAEADEWLKDTESVMVVAHAESGVAHIYPIQILMWHEIVNDTVGDLPVTVTYCPLCNTGVAFLRLFDDTLLDFGVSGRLRYSNMIMYDRQTETWWQQATGIGVAGKYASGQLRLMPMLTLSWESAQRQFPDAVVLSRNTGYSRNYGQNPYVGYDTANVPFLYRGPQLSDNFEPLSRVLSVFHNDDNDAYPYEVLRENSPVNDVVGGDAIVVIWEEGVASPLDSSAVGGGRDIGTANVFLASYEREDTTHALSFVANNGKIIDEQTKSVWTAGGIATEGDLAGTRLTPLVGVQHFWFSWTAFDPES